ncbi:CHAT domain-containing protein [Amycolatopsis sp. Hca4]|uniref:CHAT domain-containing protein n=1 Tax=Amycolatopsis sp. Hca4 TaxID=2742131 RepID=UPI00159098D3|nr:CHAT domain-containing protein [Amycolatopsis sp. Hca4]QKV80645.1 CHAT domain-containing protein [Amycolatopsis sp. Hca4]
MTDEDQAAQVKEITATVTAVCTLLVRRCLGAPRLTDADAARELSRHLVAIKAPAEVMAVATVGVWAGYGADEALDDETLAEVAEVARALLAADELDGLTLLCAVTLVLLARRGRSGNPAHDLVLAARVLWSLEHHDLAVPACREALAAPRLEPLDEAVALMLLARITGDPDDVSRLRTASRAWPAEVTARVDVRSLVVRSESRDDRLWDRARDAVVRGDRREAARLMAETTGQLIEQSGQDRGFLEGLRTGFLAMAGPEIDVEKLRRGLIEVVRQVRTRQRFGNVPPAARSGLELLVYVLHSDQNAVQGSVLAELLEALADAGLSELDLPMSDALPQLAEAELAEQAQYFALWPDLRACVDGLGGNFGLLTRRIGGGRSTAERWLAMFVSPPDGVLIRSAPLVASGASVLDRLNPAGGPVTDLTQPELDDVVAAFLHRRAAEMLAAEPARGLVVVPDGPLWRVPWQAASPLRTRPVTIAPSMTFYAGLRRAPARIRSVVALLDPAVRDAELVEQALASARDQGVLDVDFGVSALDQECDLLLVLAHGRGDGLSFRIGVGGGLTAHELARRTRARSALVACCGSAKTPPVALPINLPVSLLMRGCAHCVGGMWLLPQAPTARLVATTVGHLAAGRSLTEALALARAGSPNLLDDWGLASAGSIESWVGPAPRDGR